MAGERKLRREAAITTRSIQRAANRFGEVDVDGNQELDFEEFYAMLPASVQATRTNEEIRTWYEAADLDGNGTISIDEFFLWSLGNTSQEFGAAAISKVFERFDKDKSGQLDSTEFQAACEDMGFGNAAHTIFRALDTDGSGTVSYNEVVEALGARTESMDTGAKQALTAMVWSFNEGVAQEEKKAIDTSKWRIRGTDVEGVRKQLQELLATTGRPVADLVRLFDRVRA
jgi:Ca2+-binding EF-hand superfamily protein